MEVYEKLIRNNADNQVRQKEHADDEGRKSEIKQKETYRYPKLELQSKRAYERQNI